MLKIDLRANPGKYIDKLPRRCEVLGVVSVDGEAGALVYLQHRDVYVCCNGSQVTSLPQQRLKDALLRALIAPRGAEALATRRLMSRKAARENEGKKGSRTL